MYMYTCVCIPYRHYTCLNMYVYDTPFNMNSFSGFQNKRSRPHAWVLWYIALFQNVIWVGFADGPIRVVFYPDGGNALVKLSNRLSPPVRAWAFEWVVWSHFCHQIKIYGESVRRPWTKHQGNCQDRTSVSRLAPGLENIPAKHEIYTSIIVSTVQ